MERTEDTFEPVSPTGEQPPSPENTEFAQRVIRCAKYAGRAALSVGLGVVFALGLGDSSVNTEHVNLKIHDTFTFDLSGGTTGNLPIGDATYDTHNGPFGIELTVEEVPAEPTFELLRGEAESQSISSTAKAEAEQITDAVLPHILKTIGILGSVSALTWWGTSENAKKLTKKSIGAGILAGSIAMGVPFGVGMATYDEEALSRPTYTGILADVLNKTDVFKMLDENDQQIAEQSKYLFTLLDAIEYLGGSEEEKPALRVLSLTDIHGRNVYPLVLSMINSYDIAFVIDGGDIVDWGMPFENDFFSGGAGSTWRNNDVSIQDLGVPYYFVRGNHDKESSTVTALRKIPNVVILDKGTIFEQNGLTITGAGDPFFNPDGGINKEDENKEEGELGAQMQEFLDNNPVDIAVLHNPKAAENITHGAEIIFSGHRHKFSFEVPSKLSEPLTLVNDSAGGAGLRTFDNLEGQETQQGFTILNYSADCALQSVDRIQVTSLNGTPELKSTHIPIESVAEVKTRKCG